MVIFYIILSAVVVMLASLAGGLFLRQRLKIWMHKHIEFLVSLSAGVFVFVTYELASEAFAESSLFITMIALLSGVVLLELISRIVPEAHHHHRSHSHDHKHSRIDARRMLVGDSIHNIGDGFLLAIAFMTDVGLGIATTFAVFLHELVQEISEFFVLKEAGYTDREALTRNFITSTTILIGVLIGVFVSGGHRIEAWFSAVAAGGFLYIILRDLLPSTVSSVTRNGHLKQHVVYFLSGLVIMIFLGIFVSHS